MKAKAEKTKIKNSRRQIVATKQNRVAVIMGSKSDWPTMQAACVVLDSFEVGYETRVISAHRTPHLLYTFANEAENRGLQCIIAGAGGAAHLPGMTAAITTLPVLGVPIESKVLKGMDSLLSIVQMPKGIPVATLAIGETGAANAGLLAVQILALNDATLAKKLRGFRYEQAEAVLAMDLPK